MTDSSQIDVIAGKVNEYLKENHIHTQIQWINEQVSALSDARRNDASKIILKQILECDWKNTKTTFSKFPAGLNLQLLNQQKQVFNGSFVAQISGIVDISRAFTENKFNEEEDEEEEMDDETVSESELAKLMKGKSTAQKKKEKRSWTNGKRCLELALFDGKDECLAMEYSHLSVLHDNLLGAKVLLIGPLDVYAGIIFLRPKNIRLLSDVTFYPPADSTLKTTDPTTTTTNSANIPLIEEDFEDLLMNDDLYSDMTL